MRRRAWAKAALLAAGVAWLAGVGLWGLRVGVAREALVGWGMVVAGYAVLGALSFGGRRHRRLAAAGAACLAVAVAFATFSHLLLLAGGLGVALACLVRPDAAA
jgi:hypothetical protein